PAAKMPCCLRMSKFSATKESSASWAAARGAHSVPSWRAMATQSVPVSIAVVIIGPFLFGACVKAHRFCLVCAESIPAGLVSSFDNAVQISCQQDDNVRQPVGLLREAARCGTRRAARFGRVMCHIHPPLGQR